MSTGIAGEAVLTRGFERLPEISLPVRMLRTTRRFMRHQPLGTFGALIVLVLLVLAALPGQFAPQHYTEFNVSQRLQGPSMDHVFGTDQLGRDVFSRVVYGAQTSVVIGFGVVLVAGVLATVLGLVSAYFGSWFDLFFQRLIDIWLAFPGLIFVVFVVSIFGNSKATIILTLGLLFAASSSRVVRGVALVVASRSFIEAARSLGAGDARIILRHILPNVMPIIIINASVQVGAVILIESTLSFLGFGIPPPFPSWGRMLQEGQAAMTQHPYLSVFPGAAIAVTVYGCNVFGDALRDVLDPKLRAR